MGRLQVQDVLEQPLLRGQQLPVGVPPLHVAEAQAGAGEPGDQDPLPGPLLRALSVQLREEAALPAPGHQVLHLEPLARPRAAGEADDPLSRLLEEEVQPPGRLLADDQGAAGPLPGPVEEPEPRQGGHCPRAEELQHRGLEDQLPGGEPLLVKEGREPVPAGEPGEVLLHRPL